MMKDQEPIVRDWLTTRREIIREILKSEESLESKEQRLCSLIIGERADMLIECELNPIHRISSASEDLE